MSDPLMNAPAPSATPDTAPPDPSQIAAQQPSPVPALNGPAPQAPAGPQKPALWRGILQGALEGLAGSQGATSFAGGFAGGVGGVMAAKARREDMAMRQHASDRADAESNAHMEAQRANTEVTRQRLSQMPTEAADTHQAAVDTSTNANLDAAGKLQDRGILAEPNLELTAQFTGPSAAAAMSQAYNDSKAADALPPQARAAHDKMQSGLGSFLQSVGVPPFLTADNTHNGVVAALNQAGTQQPIPHLLNLTIGGKPVAYNLEALSKAPQGLMIVNQVRAMNALPPVTIPPSPQQLAQATTFLAPAFPKTIEEARGQANGYKSVLDARKADPNADPAMIKSLEGLVSLTKQRADKATKGDQGDKYGETFTKTMAQQDARRAGSRREYLDLASGDVTGWKPREGANLSQMQFNAANLKFTSGRLNVANSTENGYQMFQDAYKKHMAGDEKSGAASMMALFAHMGTTTSGLKGMRQTQDIIHEHRDAIGIMDKAQVFINKMKTGGALADNQWTEFGNLIVQARTNSWKNAVNEAHSMNLPVTKDMNVPPEVLGARNKYSDLGAMPVRN